MRTKTLLLTAALVAATVASASAQVFSVNAVGYVNKTIPAGKLAILGNPLNGTNNSLNTILPLTEPASGVTIFRFSLGNQGYADAIQWLDTFGWYDPANPDGTGAPPALDPGEAFFFWNTLATDVNVTFVGEVPQGHLVNTNILAGPQLSMVSSQVPQALRLGDTTINSTNTLKFPAANGDTCFAWSMPLQDYVTYLYLDGYGWYNPDDPDPAGPTLDVATGFFLMKNTGNQKVDWVRDFSVN